MMKHTVTSLFLSASLLFGIACKQTKNYPTEHQVNEMKTRMLNINRIVINNQADSISKINQANSWGLEQSKTGLWHKVYHVGQGDTARANNVVSISYEVSLLNGKKCYSSDSLGIKTFILGHGGVESGLEQGLLLMRQGDSARFVMPPHLAHGLIGDQNKIPRMSIIVYDVVLQGVEKNEQY